ncbi:MAG: hypothetical protein IPL26_15905 [Leptospiraceae bacterium]|nr:hypothetical protein [Leptospiraceae bacterium]
MELKPYQQSVINDLKSYLEKLEETSDISKAFTEFWRWRAPIVCVKVPSAGGKTFNVCNALRTLTE